MLNAAEEIRAYQRGWNEAQDWVHPHSNPYPQLTLEWLAWEQGREEGSSSAMEAARVALTLGDDRARNH